MSLLPSKPDASPPDDAGPRVIGVDDEEADDVLAALSSSTARALLSALHEEPAAPSELADTVDTTLQNAQYHLEKLESAGAVEVVETAYSEKGREMDVYAPADQPLVVYAGDEERGSMLRTALGRLLGAVALLGLASVLVQRLFGGQVGTTDDGAAGGGDGDAGGDSGAPSGEDGSGGGTVEGGDAAQAPEDEGGLGIESTGGEADADTPAGNETTDGLTDATPTDELTTTATDAADLATSGLPPGLVFFAGGLFVLAVVAGAFYLQRRRT